MDTLTPNGWQLDCSRSQNPIVQLVRQCLPSSVDIANSEVDDIHLWIIGDADPKNYFSASAT